MARADGTPECNSGPARRTLPAQLHRVGPDPFVRRCFPAPNTLVDAVYIVQVIEEEPWRVILDHRLDLLVGVDTFLSVEGGPRLEDERIKSRVLVLVHGPRGIEVRSEQGVKVRRGESVAEEGHPA